MPKLTKLGVSFISLVKSPANRQDIIYKAADKYNLTKPIKILKHDPQGLIEGVVYKADELDTQGDWADIETIRKAAHEFLMKGNNFNIDSEHNIKPNGAAVVESHVTDDKWLVTIKCDPESDVFKKVQKGEYAGLSMMGTAIKKEENPPTKTTDDSDKIADLEKAVQELTEIVKGMPHTRQLQFDADGKIITKSAGSDELLGEFKILEVE
jgi:hypothetical protein